MHQLSILLAKARIRGFLADGSGIAAVEFAYIAPLLMLMTFGTFEISRALIVHKRFQRATAMVGDLVSREEQLGATYPEAKAALDGIMLSAQHVMEPYTSTPLRMAITQLRASSSDAKKTNVEWSYSYNGMPVTNCPLAKNMPAWDMITKGNAAIVVEAQYQYTPLLTNIIPNLIKQMNWSDTMAFSPRYGSVFYGQATQNTVCPT
ncbi:MAG TPA: TadE/TadG family type IV pilus assembly protein [Hyphomicrobium sp.]|jgi:Flp pilus assembly protein TadG|uniref:TadE/TadG family type IV pilus assembly protein n=1 Tax=Hyphomicrobium sp. TaxID=82 RepID=UPI002BFA4B64|nr:TadE/TadG family type IV pilus assembly protein [Hyphomicrobium sp.]HXE01093.1 TadE/TadG family type IV pilus assembly protein [Hyphomicrobium sp.]